MTEETTTEQLAEIEGQATQYTPPDGWRPVPIGETLREGDVWVRPGDNAMFEAGHDGTVAGASRRYIRRIEPEPQPQPEPKPVQVREGRWRTRGGEVRHVTPTPASDGREERWPWWDAQYRQVWRANGRYYFDGEGPLDLVEYLGPIEEERQPQEQPEPQPPMLQDAETIRDLKALYVAASKALVDAGNENTALERQLAVVKEELTTAAAVCVRLQIELDAAQQVPADSPQLRQLRSDLAEMTRDRNEYRHAHELLVRDANTVHERTRAMTVEAIVEWLDPFRGCNSPALALLLIEALPHIMRSLTGLADEEIE